MNHINENVLLKTNWEENPYRVYVNEYHQSVIYGSNKVEMVFHCCNDGNTYHYHWISTSQRGQSWLELNGKKIEDVSMEEIARQLAVWFRQHLAPPNPIITY